MSLTIFLLTFIILKNNKSRIIINLKKIIIKLYFNIYSLSK